MCAATYQAVKFFIEQAKSGSGLPAGGFEDMPRIIIKEKLRGYKAAAIEAGLPVLTKALTCAYNLISPNQKQRHSAVEYMKWIVDIAASICLFYERLSKNPCGFCYFNKSGEFSSRRRGSLFRRLRQTPFAGIQPVPPDKAPFIFRKIGLLVSISPSGDPRRSAGPSTRKICPSRR